MPATIPSLLPTTVIGSAPVPEWMERLKSDFFRGRMSHAQLDDVHETAIKAALRDQEHAGIDVVSDGELRRDNDVDYFLARMPGVEIPHTAKDFYFDYYDARVTAPLPEPDGPGPLGFADEITFTAAQTDRTIKFSFTGPTSLAHRLHNEAYDDHRDLVVGIARLLNAEAHALVARGATQLQIDEPFLAGRPDRVAIAIEAINIVTAGVDATWGLHVCWGNRYARPSWEGHYDFLFPAVLEARVDRLLLEFARKGYDDLPAVAKHGWDRGIGVGVVDVKSPRIETADEIAGRIRRAIDVVPAEQLVVTPDCGLRHLAGPVARAKLVAMVAGARKVREALGGGAGPTEPVQAEAIPAEVIQRLAR